MSDDVKAAKARQKADDPRAQGKVDGKTMWLPLSKAFTGTHEEAVARAHGRRRDQMNFIYTDEERDGVKGKLLSGEVA